MTKPFSYRDCWTPEQGYIKSNIMREAIRRARTERAFQLGLQTKYAKSTSWLQRNYKAFSWQEILAEKMRDVWSTAIQYQQTITGEGCVPMPRMMVEHFREFGCD